VWCGVPVDLDLDLGVVHSKQAMLHPLQALSLALLCPSQTGLWVICTSAITPNRLIVVWLPLPCRLQMVFALLAVQ
jgi:hypothetical protein